MYHVDNSTGVPVMPQPSPVTSVTELFFTEGGNGVPPTYPGPDWFNAIQSELLNILRAAGLDPDKMDNTQILAALKKLFLSRSNPFGDIKADGAAAIATALANLGIPALLDSRQPINDMLTGFARLYGQPGNAANNIPYISGKNVVTTTPLTAFMRSMFGKASAADVLALLGTKTAALRDVGTGANQIPDMSSFVFSNATQGFVKHPNGFMEQWFIATVPQAPSATVNGTIDILFPNPFPNKCYGVNVNYAGITAIRDGTPFLSGMVMDKFACRVASTYFYSGLDVFVRAVGY